MRIEQLELFLRVLDTGSFALAARVEHLSQPAVSMAISSMESELDTKLFNRTPGQRKQIELTESGILLAEYARKAIDDYHKVRTGILQLKNSYNELHLVTSYGPAACVMPQLMNSFKGNFSNIPLTLTPMSGNNIYESLQNGEYSLAFSATPAPEYIHSERFFYDPLVLICPRAYKKKKAITLSELQKYPLIMRSKRSGAYQMFLNTIQEHGLTLSDFNVSMEVFGNSDILHAVSNGIGVGFVTRSSINDMNENSKYRMVPVRKFKIERHIYISRLKDHQLTESENLFWNYATGTDWRGTYFGFNTVPV